MAKKEKKIGLALGGGGARGLAHIGVLKVLVQAGIEIHKIAGTSMGAVIAAAFALEIKPESLEKEIKSYSKRQIFTKFIDAGNPKKSLIRGKKIHDNLNRLYSHKEFKDTGIPLRVVTTNLGNGKQVILKSGNIAKAVQGSVSVPGIFPPVKIDEQYLVDGGIVNPTPIDVVENMGVDLVIGVDIFMKKSLRLAEPKLHTTLLYSYEIMRSQAVKVILQKQPAVPNVIITPHTRRSIDSFKFNQVDEFIEAGETAAKKALPKIFKAIE